MNDRGMEIYCDGGARGNPGPAAAAFVVIRKGGVYYKRALFLGKKTNNEAEYIAVIMALRWLNQSKKALDNNKVLFYLDSELVTKQLSGKFRIKSTKLVNKFFLVRELEKNVGAKIKYTSVPREKNRLADYLVNKVLDQKGVKRKI